MLKIRNAAKKYRSIPVATSVTPVAMASPAFIEGGTPTTSLSNLLATFSVATTWLWREYGLLLAWILSQSILLAAICPFFAGAAVVFSTHIYHQV